MIELLTFGTFALAGGASRRWQGGDKSNFGRTAVTVVSLAAMWWGVSPEVGQHWAFVLFGAAGIAFAHRQGYKDWLNFSEMWWRFWPAALGVLPWAIFAEAGGYDDAIENYTIFLLFCLLAGLSRPALAQINDITTLKFGWSFQYTVWSEWFVGVVMGAAAIQ